MAPEDVWWDETRRRMVEHYRMAWFACHGTIMIPPLWDRKTGCLSPIHIQLDTQQISSDWTRRILASVGTTMRMQVDYLEQPPPEWQCDL